MPLILNRSAAHALFGAADPLGKLVKWGDRHAMQVVGIVGDTRLRGVTIAPEPQAYAPLMGGWGYPSVVIARATAPAASLMPAVRAAFASLAPNSPPPRITTLDDRFSEEVAQPRFYMILLGLFAAVGLALAAVGIFGMTAYSVARRAHEFGIRLAVGAEPSEIFRLVFSSSARVLGAGLAAGVAGSLAAARLLASLLYEVKPGDPLTMACVAALLSAVALLACWLAARKAASVDPGAALRTE